MAIVKVSMSRSTQTPHFSTFLTQYKRGEVMESSPPKNNDDKAQTSHTEGNKAGDKADELPNNSQNDAKTRRRITFAFFSWPFFGRRERHHGNGVPPAERRAAEQDNLQLPKVASLTGAIFSQRPTATSTITRRRHSYAPQASRDYSRCIQNLSVCTDDEREIEVEPELDGNAMDEPQVHPLRMNPVNDEKQHSTPFSTNDSASVVEAVEPSGGPEVVSVAETSFVTTTNNTDDAEEMGNGENPPPTTPCEEYAAEDDPYPVSDTSSVYDEEWFPFRELSQISWRTAGPTSAEELLPSTRKSPYRMGRTRRYGWIEGQPF
ncbi:conserved hypothetical protein [Histoplasma capsulatum H143]|uniref:Uncharacterized protein n=1 Tax=Ajellomyces capsulatus (strain H143) TaxID=544712 RepID=C6H893_AJECH|nr:conserved hypothetical protein [Histoplasma capsulatum H143]